jgi:hypothetical protein
MGGAAACGCRCQHSTRLWAPLLYVSVCVHAYGCAVLIACCEPQCALSSFALEVQSVHFSDAACDGCVHAVPSVMLCGCGLYFLHQVTAFLASLRDHLSAHLQHPDLLQLLASCVRLGSPRLQRLALLLLEYALPAAPLSLADTALAAAGLAEPTSDTSDASPGATCVRALLAVIADTLLPRPSAGSGGGAGGGGGSVAGLSSAATASSMCVAHPVGYGAGFAAAALRAQVASVLRALLGTPVWFPTVFRVLVDAVTHAAATALPSKGGARGGGAAAAAALATAQAAVIVLGCLNGGLRVGARVVTRDTVSTSAQASLAKYVRTWVTHAVICMVSL